MAPPANARTTLHRLSSTDLEHIRERLASGRKPKVVFTSSAGQVAGQAGQVVELTDPAASDEWIVVRFGRDELPFAPADLALPPPVQRRPASPKEAAAHRPESKTVSVTVPTPREESAVLTSTEPPKTEPPKTEPPKPEQPRSVPPPMMGLNGSSPDVRRPGRTVKPKTPATLTVTLAYTAREWTVAASHGTKALAKPCAIRPTDALRMVALLDVPGVHDAVESIIAAERAEAESRALRLRAELAEIESRLAELTNRT